MSITVVKAGICDTMQDLGRPGLALFGINPSGAMDRLAMQAANALAGNHLGEGVIELHFPASRFLFTSPALIALGGADFGAVIVLPDGQKIPMPTHKTALITEGATLAFTKKSSGQRCYLAVRGGFKQPLWHGSMSTNLKIKVGGFEGRKLLKGDTLLLNRQDVFFETSKVLPWMANINAWYRGGLVNILPGPERENLEDHSVKKLLSEAFTLSARSDRMGIRLEGPALKKIQDLEMVSSGVMFGTMQLLPGGGLMVLMADHAISGGYPRIGNIISAHLPMLAQLAEGQSLRFAFTDIKKAEAIWVSQMKELLFLQTAVKMRLRELGL